MDQHANTKNVSEPGQAQSPELQESARKAEEPSHKCKICGGPNHYGCGCEAKAAADAAPGEQSASEAPAALKLTPAEREETFRKVIDQIISRSSPDEIKKLLQAQFDFVKDIKIMSERSELIGDCIFDLSQLIKAISDDLKTIKEILIKKDEVKNASENQN